MATELDKYAETNADVYASQCAGSNIGSGQSFTTPNDGVHYTLDSCKWYLKKAGSPTGNAVAKIYAHSGTYGTSSIPTGSALATSDNFDVSTLSTDPALITFTFSGANRVSLTDNTYYVITIQYNDGDPSNRIQLGADGSSPSASGNYCDTPDYSTWTPDNAYDACFYVYGVGKGFIPNIIIS